MASTTGSGRQSSSKDFKSSTATVTSTSARGQRSTQEPRKPNELQPRDIEPDTNAVPTDLNRNKAVSQTSDQPLTLKNATMNYKNAVLTHCKGKKTQDNGFAAFFFAAHRRASQQ